MIIAAPDRSIYLPIIVLCLTEPTAVAAATQGLPSRSIHSLSD